MIVADAFNQRVLIWNTFPTSGSDPADVVLGRDSFTGPLGGLSGSSTAFPFGVWYDGARLYVASTLGNRVMIWNGIPTTNNAPADVFIGQPSPLADTAGAGASGLTEPRDVIVANGAMFVADTGNDRVMVWDPVPTVTGTPATYVLGQPDFATVVADPEPTARTLMDPTSLIVVGQSLFVADRGHMRVLRFPLGR